MLSKKKKNPQRRFLKNDGFDILDELYIQMNLEKNGTWPIPYEPCWAAFYKRWLKMSIKGANATNRFQAGPFSASW